MLKNTYNYVINQYIKFLDLSFSKKFFVTYILCIVGYLSITLLGMYVNSLYSLKNADFIATKKFEIVSSAVVAHTGPEVSYLSLALTYIVNNFIACFTISSAIIAVALLYRHDIKKENDTNISYLNALFIFYLLTIINPFTGLSGAKLRYLDLIAVIPHGIFEFGAVALSISLGIHYALKILPLSYTLNLNSKKENVSNELLDNNANGANNENNADNNNKSTNISNIKNLPKLKLRDYINYIILLATILTLVSIAGILEPLDWALRNYSIANNINMIDLFIESYKNLIYYIIPGLIGDLLSKF
ncbi:putative membrane protein SpoIIM required for sporulation [Methanococcus voltae]|uniref:hypothetical protein n=1 Tax=Methanococcus voltae TaxID=2188 RepID=UPI001AEAB3C9|nr:hypothetical protein [Methanococcus voltae]MBP2143730.1 putative membrane protein SpoIIM required for sporulation [Methanococcus voltae]